MSDRNAVDRWAPVQAVRDWLSAAGLPVADQPTLNVSAEQRAMAVALIEEEAAEFRTAVETSDLVEIADAVADLLWVTIEAGVTFGIPIESVFGEVTRSNRSKVETGPITRNAVGKIIKGAGFSPPDLRPILEAHGASPEDLESPPR